MSETENKEKYDHKKYMQSYIKDPQRGGKLIRCEDCNTNYKAYNKHKHIQTLKHKRNTEKDMQLSGNDVDKLISLLAKLK